MFLYLENQQSHLMHFSFLLSFAVLILLLILFNSIKSRYNKSDFSKALNLFEGDNVLMFTDLGCYCSSFGGKKRYPSYPSKVTVYVKEGMFMVLGKQMGFVHTPFILTLTNVESVVQQAGITRVFKPHKIQGTGKTVCINFIDTLFIKTKIDYDIVFKNTEDATLFLEKLKGSI